MLRSVILLVATVALASAGSIDVGDCGSTVAVRDVRVEGCDATPCVFIKGQSYEVELDGAGLNDTEPTNTLRYKISARVIVDITIKEGDACEELIVGDCPALPEEEFSFKTSIDILQIYPAVATTVTAQVWNDNDETLICIEIPVDVRNP